MHCRSCSVLLDQLDRRLLTNARHARHIVGRIAHQRLHIDRLGGGVTQPGFHGRGVHRFVGLDIKHLRVVIENLPQILVLGDQKNLISLVLQSASHRRNDIIRLKPRLDENRHARIANDPQDPLLLRIEIIRPGLAIGLVLRPKLLAKQGRFAGVINHHRQIIRLAVLDQIQQHLREDKRSPCGLAGGTCQITKRSEVRAVNLGVTVDDVEGFGHEL